MPSPDPPLPEQKRALGVTPKESSKSEQLSPANDAGDTAFGPGYRLANSDHWARYLHWLPREAACVTCGVDPRSFPEMDGAAVAAPFDELAEQVWFRTESFRRAVDVGLLDALIAPLDAMNFLDELRAEYPPELREIAESIRPYASLAGKGARKRARQNPSTFTKSPILPAKDEASDTTPGQTKIIATLYKMLVAIAVEKHDFVPERPNNPTAGRLHRIVSKHFKMDVDTIREHLKIGAEEHWDERLK